MVYNGIYETRLSKVISFGPAGRCIIVKLNIELATFDDLNIDLERGGLVIQVLQAIEVFSTD